MQENLQKSGEMWGVYEIYFVPLKRKRKTGHFGRLGDWSFSRLGSHTTKSPDRIAQEK